VVTPALYPTTEVVLVMVAAPVVTLISAISRVAESDDLALPERDAPEVVVAHVADEGRDPRGEVEAGQAIGTRGGGLEGREQPHAGVVDQVAAGLVPGAGLVPMRVSAAVVVPTNNVATDRA